MNKIESLLEAEKELDALVAYEFISPQQINFYKDLLKIINKYRFSFQQENIFPPLTSKKALNKIKKEEPLLNLSQIKLRRKYLKDIFIDLSKSIQKYNLFEDKEVEQLKKAYQEKKVDLKQLIIENIIQNSKHTGSFSTTLQVNPDILVFIATYSIKPVLESVPIIYYDLASSAGWYKNFCPICGSFPYISELSQEEGRRILKCFLCNCEWLFSRLKCPFCNNEDQKSHKYFYIEEDSPYRVDVCDKCHHYIKVVDKRKYPLGKRVNLFIEHISTIYLDFKAYEEGYTNKTIFSKQDNLATLDKIH